MNATTSPMRSRYMPLYMKPLLILAFGLLFTTTLYGQLSFDDWEAESKWNKRLLPRYGHLPKTEQEIKSDSTYIKEIMAQPQFKTKREASNHLIHLGFQYYYRPDFKTAMYRFNQAYLLDSTNTDIFWGYGAIYMAFGQYELAKKQYQVGLAIDSTNNHLMTDLATYFMEQFYVMSQMPINDIVKDPKKEAKYFMDSALYYLNKSYTIDSKDANTVYKLSICYWNIEDCKNAWKYYDMAVALGCQMITPEYTNDLKKRCKRM
jgi:tetratricopeptide (TPR) repeat protein